MPAAPVVVAESVPVAFVLAAPEATEMVRPSAVNGVPLLIASRLVREIEPVVMVSAVAPPVSVALPICRALAFDSPMPPLTPPVPAIREIEPEVRVSAPPPVPFRLTFPVFRMPEPEMPVAADTEIFPLTGL